MLHVRLEVFDEFGGRMTVGDDDAAFSRALQNIDEANTAESAVDALATFAGRCGLTHALVVIPPLYDDLSSERDMLGVMPPAFADAFLENRTLTQDAVVGAVRIGKCVVTWRDFSPWEAATTTAQGLKSELQRMGLTCGMAIPAFGPGGATGLVLLAGVEMSKGNMVESHLSALAVYAFDRANNLKRTERRDFYNLSGREYECLRWCAAGKTDWEIGQILSISPKTVNYHIENAKRKMSVQTRVQAVVAALDVGGIDS